MASMDGGVSVGQQRAIVNTQFADEHAWHSWLTACRYITQSIGYLHERHLPGCECQSADSPAG